MARSKVWVRAHYRRLAILIACAVAIVSVPITVPSTQVAAAGASPAIVALSPEAGPTTGGTTVTVYGDPNGANFLAGSTSVAFGLQAGTNVNVLSATKLTVSSPPQAAGQVTVTVTVSGVTSSSAVSQATTYEFVASGPFHALQARIFISSGQDIPAGTTKDVQVTGQGGIPTSGVSAVVFDLAAVPPPGDSGILEVLPTGLNKYTATNVAFQNGHYTTTLATVPLGVGGKIEIFNPNGFAMGAAIDVEGYVSSTQGDASGLLNSVPAARICDTRAGTPTTAGPMCGSGHQLGFNDPKTVQVTGNGGIPSSGVAAVILNLIAFNGLSGSSGNLLVYPTGGPQPPTVQLIWTGGVPANNHLIVPVSSTGSITINNQPGAGSGTDIIVEVEGWITDNSNPAAAGTLYNGNNGTRVCDTRTGSQVDPQCQGKTLGAGTNSETLPVMIAGHGGVAPLGSGLGSVEVAVTALNSTAAATNLILYPSNASPPNCSNPQTSDLFLFQAGMVMNTDVILPLGPDGKINVTNCQGAVDVTIDVLGYYTAKVQPYLAGSAALASSALPTYTTGNHPIAAVTGNFDGHVDVVTANQYDHTLSFFPGLGNGNLGSPSTISLPGEPDAVAAGHFDSSGNLDLAVADSTNLSVDVLLGNGRGGFATPVRYSVPKMGTGPMGIAAVSLRNNRLTDLAVADGSPNPTTSQAPLVTVLLGNGDGTFSYKGDFSVGGGIYQNAVQVVAADFNRDGNPDLAVVAENDGFYQGHLSILLGNGDGTFQGFTQTSDTYDDSVAVADLNNDGIPDLITTGQPIQSSPPAPTPIPLRALVGNADGTFQAPVSFPGDLPGENVLAVDLEGDGRPDVLRTSGYNGGAVSVYQNTGSGLAPLGDVAVPGAQYLAAGDLNGDGAPDVVTVNTGNNTISVLLNKTLTPAGGKLSPMETLGNGNFCWQCASQKIAQGAGGDPVNTATGNFSETSTDLAIPGRGIPLVFSRTYNSLAASAVGTLGFGWTSDYQMSMTFGFNSATVIQENGAQVTFNLVNGAYAAPPRATATLAQNPDSTYTFTRQGTQLFDFNSSGLLLDLRDLNGYKTQLTYTNGQLSSIADPANRTFTLGYTGPYITSVTDANVTPARVVSFQYNDGQGNLTDVIDVNGGHTHYTYDSSHHLTNMLDANCYAAGNACNGGNGVVNHYTSAGQVDWQQDQLGRTTSFCYAAPASSCGNSILGSTMITDPKGNVSVDQYSGGVRVAVTRGYGTSQAATWAYGYDPSTLAVTSVTDPNAHTRTTVPYADGHPHTVTDALNQVTTFTWNTLNGVTVNEPLTIKDPTGVTTTNQYDSAGNLKSVSRPLLNSQGATVATQTTSYAYGDVNHPGDMTAMTDPNGKVWSYGYDGYGNRTSSTDPLANKTTYCFNAIGWMRSSNSPKGNATPCGTVGQYTTTYSYVDTVSGKTNQDGLVAAVTDPLGHVVQDHYDADRNLTSSVDPDNKTTSFTFDLANEPTLTTRADTTTLKTDYNPDGTMLDQVDGANNKTTYAYDPLAHLKSLTTPATTPCGTGGCQTSYTIDAVGNLKTVVDPQQRTTTYGYDADNHLKSITYTDGHTPNGSNILYDANGHRTSMTDGTGTSSWAYDSLNRLTTSTNGAGAVVGHDYLAPSLPGGYDLTGQVRHIVYPGSVGTVTRGYDDAGRLTSVQDWLGNTTQFGYDANSNFTTETFPGTGNVDTLSPDAANRLMGLSDMQGSSPLASFTYGRDAANQVTSEAYSFSGAPSTSVNYGYTTLNQVCFSAPTAGGTCSPPPAGATAYGYDAADNLKTDGTSSQTFDGANELCSTGVAPAACGSTSPPVGVTSFGYDQQGNRTVKTLSGVAATTYGYDQANRLTSFSPPAPASSTTYAYNGDGLRMSKTVGGTAEPFVWNIVGGLPLMIGDGSTSYIYGLGGQPLESISSSGTVTYHHQDQLGSTRLLTSSTGASVGTYTYDAYGNVTVHTGTASTPLQYAGQYTDAESGLQYLRARYYDPATGQFLSRDPLTPLTRSPYGYVAGNPLNNADPTGAADEEILGGCAALEIPVVGEVACGGSVGAYLGDNGPSLINAIGDFLGGIGDLFGGGGGGGGGGGTGSGGPDDTNNGKMARTIAAQSWAGHSDAWQNEWQPNGWGIGCEADLGRYVENVLNNPDDSAEGNFGRNHHHKAIAIDSENDVVVIYDYDNPAMSTAFVADIGAEAYLKREKGGG